MATKNPRPQQTILEAEALAQRLYLERGGDALDELIECDRLAVRVFRAQLQRGEDEPRTLRTGVQMNALLGRHLAQRERMMRDCRKLADEILAGNALQPSVPAGATASDDREWAQAPQTLAAPEPSSVSPANGGASHAPHARAECPRHDESPSPAEAATQDSAANAALEHRMQEQESAESIRQQTMARHKRGFDFSALRG